MSSPNEPGPPRPAGRPGGSNGSGSDVGAAAGKASGAAQRASGQITDTGEPPPWQRGAGRVTQPSSESAESRDGEPRSAGSPGLEARVQRFVAGGDAKESDQQGRPPRPGAGAQRGEPVRPEAYASELPDLSGPVPRSAQRKTSGEAASAKTSNAPAGRIQVAHRTAHQGPVRASMQIRRVDPWTVLKVSLVLSVVLFFVWMIAVAFLYLVLGAMGVWTKLNSNVGDLLTSASGSSGGELVSSGTIFGGSALIGLVNIVVLCAMATIGAFIYNLTTDLVGGVEVTLADRD